MRHGEVFNPDRILYGRLEGYHLSELGHRMAAAAAESMKERPITALYASPLLRAQESAAPWSTLWAADPVWASGGVLSASEESGCCAPRAPQPLR